MPPKLPAASELLKPEQMQQVFANARAQQAVMFARVAAPDNYQPLHADRLICVADDWPA